MSLDAASRWHKPGHTDKNLLSHAVLSQIDIRFGEEREDLFAFFFFVMGIALFKGAFDAISNHIALFYFHTIFFIDSQIPLRIRYDTVTDIATHSP
jgi:hypothetical protein